MNDQVVLRGAARTIHDLMNNRYIQSVIIDIGNSVGYVTLSKLQWLQDPSEITGDNRNNVRREIGRHFRNKKREFF
jgi:hypothetical protein